jgi:ubiquitin-like 1-activating enzyme E1 B
MEDMWRFRDKPVALDFDLIQGDQFILRGQAANALDVSADIMKRSANGGGDVDGRLNGSSTTFPNGSNTPTTKASTVRSGHGLKDQRSLSLRENLELFITRWVSSHPQSNSVLTSSLKYGAPRSAPHNWQRGDNII